MIGLPDSVPVNGETFRFVVLMLLEQYGSDPLLTSPYLSGICARSPLRPGPAMVAGAGAAALTWRRSRQRRRSSDGRPSRSDPRRGRRGTVDGGRPVALERSGPGAAARAEEVVVVAVSPGGGRAHVGPGRRPVGRPGHPDRPDPGRDRKNQDRPAAATPAR